MATSSGAWAAHADQERGRLAVGYQADLAVLSQDILSQPPAALLETRVLLTIVAGRVVFVA